MFAPSGYADFMVEDRATDLPGFALSGCTACGSREAAARVVIRRGALPRPIATAVLLAPSLTAREAAAFDLLGLGYDNRSIARMLSISERTAKRHITAILTKLRLESRLQAGLASMIKSLITEAERACCRGLVR